MAQEPKKRGFGSAMQPPANEGSSPANEGTSTPNEGSSDAPDDREPATPEEQAQYEKFVDKAKELIYDDGAMPAILERLKAEGDEEAGGLIDNIAQVAVMVVMRVLTAAQKAGEQIADSVLFAAGTDVVELLGELVEEAGIGDVDEKMLEGALYRALDIWVQSGQANTEALAAEFEQIVAADAEGRIDQVLPGLPKAKGE